MPEAWLARCAQATGSPLRRILLSMLFSVLGISLAALQYRGALRVDSDSVSYALRMMDLAHGEILKPSIVWPLGWPALALPLYLSGLKPLYAMMAVAALFYLALVWSAGEIVYPRLGPLPTLALYGLLGLEPFFSFELWPGLTDVPFCAVVVLVLLLSLQELSCRNSLALSAVAALGCYLRYPGLFFLVALPVLQLVRCWYGRRQYGQILVAWLFLALLLVPMFLRNYLAAGQLLWGGAVKNGTLTDTAALWSFYHFRAALLLPSSFYDRLLGGQPLGVALAAIGGGGLVAIALITLKLRRDPLVTLSFLLLTMYAGAMIAPRFHVEPRYLMPELSLLLVWLLAVAAALRPARPRLYAATLGFLLLHAVAASGYLAQKGYHLEGAPDLAACFAEFGGSDLPGTRLLVTDQLSRSLLALLRDTRAATVPLSGGPAALETIRQGGRSAVIAVAGRGPRGNPEPRFTPWAGQLLVWARMFPKEFRVSHQGRWLLVVDHY